MFHLSKYLPHLSISTLIFLLVTDYFPATKIKFSHDSEKPMSIDEVGHKEGSNRKDQNFSQEERERRMAIFHYNEGNKFYKEKNYIAATTRFEKALHHNEKFKEALINLSTAYMKLRVFDKALETIQKGQKQFPQEPLFDYNFACYYSLRKNLSAGLLALKQSVDKGFKQFKQIENDSDLRNLRQSNEYKIWREKISVLIAT
jgi:outer membrane protein assembly factor BamD (BamD/ComL family)